MRELRRARKATQQDMNREEFIRYCLSQLSSLEQGLEGFSRLFHAVSENLTMQIRSFPVDDAETTHAEVDGLRRELARLRSQGDVTAEVGALRSRLAASEQQRQAMVQQVNQLQDAEARARRDLETDHRQHAEKLSALDAEIERLRRLAETASASAADAQQLEQLEASFEQARSDGITAWDRVHGLEQELEATTQALHSAQSDGISAWDRVLALEQEVEGLRDQARTEVGPSDEVSQLHRRLVELEDENAGLRSDLASTRSLTIRPETPAAAATSVSPRASATPATPEPQTPPAATGLQPGPQTPPAATGLQPGRPELAPNELPPGSPTAPVAAPWAPVSHPNETGPQPAPTSGGVASQPSASSSTLASPRPEFPPDAAEAAEPSPTSTPGQEKPGQPARAAATTGPGNTPPTADTE
jgi:predicted  nucleic acid-binding Zn-ribbon protein